MLNLPETFTNDVLGYEEHSCRISRQINKKVVDV